MRLAGLSGHETGAGAVDEHDPFSVRCHHHLLSPCATADSVMVIAPAFIKVRVNRCSAIPTPLCEGNTHRSIPPLRGRAIAFDRSADIPSPHRGEEERHVVAKCDSPASRGRGLKLLHD